MPALLQLDRLSFVLPDGRTLFSDLQFFFAPQRIGLVGDNGVGKSVLARLLAGQAQPSSGAARCDGSVHYVAQELDPQHYPTVAALAGVTSLLAALARIAEGSIDEADYALVGERWDAHARLRQALDALDLRHVDADTPTASLSGGERQRIALQGAWLSQADWLVLDEPSNHLDAQQRARLVAQMARWPGGLLLVSHDRACWRTSMKSSSCRRRACAAMAAITRCMRSSARWSRPVLRLPCRRKRPAPDANSAMAQQQAERQQKRVTRGEREGREGNQSKLLLDARKEKSQDSQGKLRLRAQEAQQARQQRVMDASARCAPEAERLLLAPESAVPNGKLLLELRELVLPHGQAHAINLVISGPRRLAVTGNNGSGKSTLLRVIAGQLAPASGALRCHARVAWLDQHAGLQDGEWSAVQRLQARNSILPEGELRTRWRCWALPARAPPCPAVC